ncbi:PQQ-binding-like beta-propeller repeat protein [Chitiniphilus purpureus]|uniref:PQQ-binding-like beta-propeller repeat protein n=2 Tax=Chitiniphilus purpureus TaxID=2981137 RepID=A0ABY6DKU6_9NEIS|nr:PQQ-binding-like beta-propeller repeat protein [Chitiniphilus sp. CD1]UXY14986.1 PQQ-binding-like beta-propeller repeat protein [Chitiniphilus sp. CD1]
MRAPLYALALSAAALHVQAAPGDIRWQLATGAPIRAAPLRIDDLIVVGNFKGLVQAHAAGDRQLRWQTQLKGSLSSQPARSGDALIVQTSRQLYALSGKDGRVLWQRDLGDQGDWSMFKLWDSYQASPIVRGDMLLVAFGNALHALDAQSGQTRWRYAASDRIMATPTVAGTQVLVADAGGRLAAVRLADGKPTWQQQPNRDTIQSAIATWQQLGIYGSRDAAVHAVDLASGKPRWQVSHGTDWVVATPLVHGNTVYVGSSDGLFLQALAAKDGKALWRVNTGQNAFTAPLAYDGQIVLATGDAYRPQAPGKVSAVGQDGKLRWQATLPAGLFGQPVIDGDTLLVGAEDGTLYGVALR